MQAKGYIDPLNPHTSNISHFTGACETGRRFPSIDYLSPFDAVGRVMWHQLLLEMLARVPVVLDSFYYEKDSGGAPCACGVLFVGLSKRSSPSLEALYTRMQQWMDRWTYQHSDDQLDQMNHQQILLRSKVLCLMHVVSYSPWAVGVDACSTDSSYPGSLLLGNGQKVGGVHGFCVDIQEAALLS
ncbi:hypothetical protein SADUNF_Sadunf04G0003300 [Salix dunnii]|uniref:Uncharacterized protein n=1 Tax=Salix dunnii TaxID=1413687 RepID=A0A835K584_9ROSI|nr:hypothetical protein SADUNF_Sadunf04G0003300 [Salix dunnii]